MKQYASSSLNLFLETCIMELLRRWNAKLVNGKLKLSTCYVFGHREEAQAFLKKDCLVTESTYKGTEVMATVLWNNAEVLIESDLGRESLKHALMVATSYDEAYGWYGPPASGDWTVDFQGDGPHAA